MINSSRLIGMFLMAGLLVSCVSGDKKNQSRKEGFQKSELLESDNLQDVKSVDSTYSDKIYFYSNLEDRKLRNSCTDYKRIDKADWRKLVEAGTDCIGDKNWSALSEVADILSHSHLKAAWGPYFKSVVAESKKDYARALWMIDLADRKAPNDPVIRYQKARLLWATEKETEAFNMLKKIVKSDSENLDALLFLGYIQYRDREFKEAIKYFEEVLKYARKDASFNAAIAEAYFFTDKYEKSISFYKAAASREDLNASLYYKIGLAYKNLKNWQQAKVYLDKATSQRRRGRTLASLTDDELRLTLKEVETQLQKEKNPKPAAGVNDEDKEVRSEKNI